MFKNVMEKLQDRMFKKVNNVVWDMQTGSLGVETDEGIASLVGEGEDAEISYNIFTEMAMPIPAFAQSTSLENVKVGDIIQYKNKVKGWVIAVDHKPATPQVLNADGSVKAEAKSETRKFKMMKPDGMSGNWTPPKVSMLGMGTGGVMVVQSLLTMLPGGENGLEGMQKSLMPLMMMGGEESMDEMLPMLLMSQMSGSGDGNSMLNTMMLMKMMGRSGKSGKIGNFFDS